MTTTMSGWLRDPTGRFAQRYWDGEQWTEHVARGGLQGTDPLDWSPARPVEAWSPEERLDDFRERQHQSRRRTVIGIAVGLALVVALMAALALTPDPPPNFDGLPGDRSVYAEIRQEDNCFDLLAGYERNWADAVRRGANDPGDPIGKVVTGYATAYWMQMGHHDCPNRPTEIGG